MRSLHETGKWQKSSLISQEKVNKELVAGTDAGMGLRGRVGVWGAGILLLSPGGGTHMNTHTHTHRGAHMRMLHLHLSDITGRPLKFKVHD